MLNFSFTTLAQRKYSNFILNVYPLFKKVEILNKVQNDGGIVPE